MTSAGTERRHLIARGRVQGVAFRYHTAEEARRLGLAGFVRNLADGSVEAAFEGPPDALRAIEAWCREGPPHARVDSVEVRTEPTEGLADFRIR